jgi:hypothetical protein
MRAFADPSFVHFEFVLRQAVVVDRIRASGQQHFFANSSGFFGVHAALYQRIVDVEASKQAGKQIEFLWGDGDAAQDGTRRSTALVVVRI